MQARALEALALAAVEPVAIAQGWSARCHSMPALAARVARCAAQDTCNFPRALSNSRRAAPGVVRPFASRPRLPDCPGRAGSAWREGLTELPLPTIASSVKARVEPALPVAFSMAQMPLIEPRPRSIAEAVDFVIAYLNIGNREAIAVLDESGLWSLHHGLGTWIRNQ
ncbi:MAG TPA: hypothetical protein VHT91_13110 [Kofleriaceae bacterium]|jgi:hypothetical protein|nr:hypothetical protein [Kofleriaceae bacterium]